MDGLTVLTKIVEAFRPSISTANTSLCSLSAIPTLRRMIPKFLSARRSYTQCFPQVKYFNPLLQGKHSTLSYDEGVASFVEHETLLQLCRSVLFFVLKSLTQNLTVSLPDAGTGANYRSRGRWCRS